MFNNFLKSLSILKKFLFINLIIFLFIGCLTIIYAGSVKPNLILKKTVNHIKIIENTINHILRLNIKFEEEDIRRFLFSTRFLFQNLDRVILFDNQFNLVGDTDTLDLDPRSFSSRLDIVQLEILSQEIRQKKTEKKDINVNLEETKNIISHGKLKLDPSQLECEWDGKQLPDKLTTTEFLIVKELAKRPGIIKERAQLMDIAYREDTDIEDRTIDSHVKRIRKKFKKVDPDFTAIETRYGSGYRWNVS